MIIALMRIVLLNIHQMKKKNSDKCRVHYLKIVNYDNGFETKVPYFSFIFWLITIALFFKPIRNLLNLN